MKKLLALLLSVIMVLSLTACGGNKESTPAATGNAQQETTAGGYRKLAKDEYLSLITGSSGGGWYIMGALFNDKFESNIPGLKMTLLPGGGASNPTVVNGGTDAQIGFTYITNAVAAKAGSGDYEKCDNMYALCNLSVKQFLHLCVSADYKYQTLDEIINNKDGIKMAVGPRAGGNEVAFGRILEQYGVKYDDIESWGGSIQYISAKEGCDAVKDGQVNGNANLSAIPLGVITEMTASKKITFLSIPDDKAKAACEKYGYTQESIPAGTYTNTEAIPTIADTVVLVISGNVSNDLAYNLAKCLAENKQAWGDGYAALGAFDPANAGSCGIPLHPGAEEYYKEAGILK